MNHKILFIIVNGIVAISAFGILYGEDKTTNENMTSNDNIQEIQFNMPQAFAETDCGILADTGRNVVEFNLTGESVELPIIGGKTYNAMTFNGQVPGPTLRVTQGDVVKMTLTIPDDEVTGHGNDMHASQISSLNFDSVNPGETSQYCYIAETAGVFKYHGSGVHLIGMDQHVLSGMYGIVIVDPAYGYKKLLIEKTYVWNGKVETGIRICSADALEFQLQYNQLYLTPEGNYDAGAMFQHHNSATVVNGMQFGYTPTDSYNSLFSHSSGFKIKPWNNAESPYDGHPLFVPTGAHTRWFVENLGNELLYFHIEGETLDRVVQGNVIVAQGIDTWTIGGSHGAIIDVVFDEPGTYLVVNHDYSAMYTGALSVIYVEDSFGGWPIGNPSDVIPPLGTNSIQHSKIDLHGLYTKQRANDIAITIPPSQSSLDYGSCTGITRITLPEVQEELVEEEKGFNEYPTASFSFKIEEPATYFFDATASWDIDGTIIEHNWDFGDGTIGEGEKPTHQYQNNGKYDVVLLVIDDKNSTDIEIHSINITETSELVEEKLVEEKLVEEKLVEEKLVEEKLVEEKLVEEKLVVCGAGTELVDGVCQVVTSEPKPKEEIPIELIIIGIVVGSVVTAGAYIANQIKKGHLTGRANVKIDVQVDLE